MSFLLFGQGLRHNAVCFIYNIPFSVWRWPSCSTYFCGCCCCCCCYCSLFSGDRQGLENFHGLKLYFLVVIVVGVVFVVVLFLVYTGEGKVLLLRRCLCCCQRGTPSKVRCDKYGMHPTAACCAVSSVFGNVFVSRSDGDLSAPPPPARLCLFCGCVLTSRDGHQSLRLLLLETGLRCNVESWLGLPRPAWLRVIESMDQSDGRVINESMPWWSNQPITRSDDGTID